MFEINDAASIRVITEIGPNKVSVIIVDDFYKNPDEIRNLALKTKPITKEENPQLNGGVHKKRIYLETDDVRNNLKDTYSNLVSVPNIWKMKKQDKLFNHIKKNKNIFLSQFTLNRIKSNEDTTRARSVLFLGLSIYSAINLNIPKIITPENGLISINLPLTSSRAGANSTRTMHPYFIKSFQNALLLLGHNITIENPYIDKTKGEMLVECKNEILLKTLLKSSMSCSHPSIKQQWKRRDVSHCGYCMPCIIRRASIHRYNGLLDQGGDYGIDIFNEDEMTLEQDGVIPRNIKAMLEFLSLRHDKRTYKKLLNQVVKIDNTDEIIKMLINGYDEIRLLVRDKGSKEMQRIALI